MEARGQKGPQMDGWNIGVTSNIFRDDQLVVNGTGVACMTYGRHEKYTSINHKI